MWGRCKDNTIYFTIFFNSPPCHSIYEFSQLQVYGCEFQQQCNKPMSTIGNDRSTSLDESSENGLQLTFVTFLSLTPFYWNKFSSDMRENLNYAYKERGDKSILRLKKYKRKPSFINRAQITGIMTSTWVIIFQFSKNVSCVHPHILISSVCL